MNRPVSRPHNSVERGKELREIEAREAAAREKKYYGDALPAVQFLRSRGYAINTENGRIRVGNVFKTRDEIKAMSAREHRLAGPSSAVRTPSRSAGGLKIGQVVKLPPRHARPAANRPLSNVKTGLGTLNQPRARKLSGAAAAQKAKALEHSTDLGSRPRLEWLPIEKLAVDRRYQRDVGKHGAAHIVRIRRHFSWSRYQPIVVTAAGDGSGGMFYVVDGQHRLEAARKHPLIDALPCYVVEALSVADQAAIFVSANSDRISVLRIHKFWAAHAAGEKTARRIAKLCADAGVTIARGQIPRPVPPLTTIATFSLEKLLPGGEAPLAQALRILATAQPGAADVFRAATIVAVTRICSPALPIPEAGAVKAIAALDLSAELGKAQVERARGGGKIEQAMETILRRHLGLAPHKVAAE